MTNAAEVSFRLVTDSVRRVYIGDWELTLYPSGTVELAGPEWPGDDSPPFLALFGVGDDWECEFFGDGADLVIRYTDPAA